VVGYGDVPPYGYTHPIGFSLHGPNSGNWFDLGTLGGERSDMEVMCMGIANNGMIVGHAAIPGDEIIKAFAWTEKTGMVDIGTLAGPDYKFSLAFDVNKSGNLIVGWSGSGWMTENTMPVVWTPKVTWTMSGPTATWNIAKLETEGFDAAYWFATAVNNRGQIIGVATNSSGVQIAVLWNPGPKGWKLMQLPVTSDYPNAYAADINDLGEIVGFVAGPDWSTGFPTLWKPVQGRGNAYTLTQLLSLTGSEQGWAMARGINNRGDIVGDSLDNNGNDIAARWSTKDPGFIQVLTFPGTWSYAARVNDNGIALGAYGSDTIPSNIATVQLR
jgi:probable HAF family extracellular repeat protein